MTDLDSYDYFEIFARSFDNPLPTERQLYNSASAFFNRLLLANVQIIPLVNVLQNDPNVELKINDTFDGVKTELHAVLKNFSLSKNKREHDECNNNKQSAIDKMSLHKAFWDANSKTCSNTKIGMHALFNASEFLPDCFEIHPKIVKHVKPSYADTEFLEDIPIYFFIKMGYYTMTSHSSLLIYLKGKLYSLGFGKSHNNNVNILIGDHAIMNSMKSKTKNVDEGIHVVDIGLLTQFHVDRINNIISKINAANVSICLSLCDQGFKLSKIFFEIEINSSYCELAPNPTAKHNSSRRMQLLTLQKTPKVYSTTRLPTVGLNCTSSLQWIFSQTVQCIGGSKTSLTKNLIGKSVVIPGKCTRIKFIAEKGYPVVDPITQDNLNAVFRLIEYLYITSDATTNVWQFNQAVSTSPAAALSPAATALSPAATASVPETKVVKSVIDTFAGGKKHTRKRRKYHRTRKTQRRKNTKKRKTKRYV